MSDAPDFPKLTGQTILVLSAGEDCDLLRLVQRMADEDGRKMILAYPSNVRFESIQAKLLRFPLPVEFVRTNAVKLGGIAPASMDGLVCFRTLSAVNAIAGQGLLALHRFFEVLKPGGWLHIEEELPYYLAAGEAQQFWAQIRALVRSAQAFNRSKSVSAYQPEVLESIVERVGFEDIRLEDITCLMTREKLWAETWPQLELLLKNEQDELARKAFSQKADALASQLDGEGEVEIPGYRLQANKPWRIE